MSNKIYVQLAYIRVLACNTNKDTPRSSRFVLDVAYSYASKNETKSCKYASTLRSARMEVLVYSTSTSVDARKAFIFPCINKSESSLYGSSKGLSF